MNRGTHSQVEKCKQKFKTEKEDNLGSNNVAEKSGLKV
jgi:hypothetical protein